jgi:hypothetical protein
MLSGVPMKRFLIVAILPLILSGFYVDAVATACPTNYAYRKVIAINPVLVGASDQTNFPMPFCFNTTTDNGGSCPSLLDFKTVANSGKIQHTVTGAMGTTIPADMEWCDAATGGNTIPYGIKAYTASSGATAGMVVVPTASHTNWTFISVVYGDASVSTIKENWPSVVSTSGAIAIWPLGDGSTLRVAEAGNTYNGTNNNATVVSGHLGGGAAFSGSSQNITTSSSTALNPTGGMTLIDWWKPASTAANVYMVASKSDGTNGWDHYNYSGTANWQINQAGNTSLIRSNLAIPTTSYTHFCGLANSTPNSSSNFKLYLNGTQDTGQGGTTYGSASIPTNAFTMTIGKRPSGTTFDYNGQSSDFMLFGSNKGGDFCKAMYNAGLNPAQFYVVVNTGTPAGLGAVGNYCVPVNVGAGQFPTTDQTNFPELFFGLWPWMAQIASGGYSANVNYYDIVWYSDSACTTKIPFERVFVDSTTNLSAWRFLLSTGSHTTTNTRYVGIGDSSITTDQQNKPGVWGNNGYVGVYSGGSPFSLSGVSSGSDGVTLSCGANAFSTLTPLGPGFYFDASGTDAATCGYVPPGTLSGLGYPTGATAPRHTRGVVKLGTITGALNRNFYAFGKANGTGQWGCQFAYSPPSSSLLGTTTGDWQDASPGVATGASSTPLFGPGGNGDVGWHVCEIDCPTNAGAINTCTLYIDGTAVGSPFSYSPTNVPNIDNGTGTAEIRLGRNAAHAGDYANAFMTQVEFSTNTFDGNYPMARYRNEFQPWDYISLGTAVLITPPAGSGEQLIPGIITRLNDPRSMTEEIASNPVAGRYIRNSISGEMKYGASASFSDIPSDFHNIAAGIRNREASWTWKWNAQRLPIRIADPKTIPTSKVFFHSDIRGMVRNTDSVNAAGKANALPKNDVSPISEMNFVGVSAFSAAVVIPSTLIGQRNPKNIALTR